MSLMSEEKKLNIEEFFKNLEHNYHLVSKG